MSVRLLIGDVRDQLRTLPDDCVHCCVTSPPYWGLRDYGVSGQIGLEPDIRDYVAIMVEVFRDLRRVLRADGTLWLNLGDSYCSTDKWGGGGVTGKQTIAPDGSVPSWQVRERKPTQVGLKPKDLCGIPWRVAFALQDDGWWLRQDIIWAKPNPMPESVTDRCTKAHEYLFLMTKSARYHFDAEAIAENCVKIGTPGHLTPGVGSYQNVQHTPKTRASGNKSHKAVTEYEASDSEEHRTKAGLLKIADTAYPMRNKRSVWTVATAPFSGAHFATFPPDLIEPCILAGCPIGGTVLDPFGGAGTTGLVADRLNRNAILIEINPEYAAMAEKRIKGDSPLFAEVAA